MEHKGIFGGFVSRIKADKGRVLTKEQQKKIDDLKAYNEELKRGETYKTDIGYISEKIGDEYKQWRKGEYVYIGADTGTGKTWFVFHALAPFAADKGKKILYLCNRVALKKDVEKLKRKAEQELQCTFNNVHIMTYQSVNEIIKKREYNENPETDRMIRELEIEYEKKIEECDTVDEQRALNFERVEKEIELKEEAGKQNMYRYKRLYEYDYIVADEFHYFAEDSMFSQDTHYSHEFIFSHSDQIKILISATGKYGLQSLKGGKADYTYTASSDKTAVNLKFYRDNRTMDDDYPLEIITKVLESEKESKIIYFVEDINRINNVWEKLEKWRSEVTCLFSEAREDKNKINSISDPDTIYDIGEGGTTFAHRVLLTTSVLSNGVTLKDRNIKHIICDIPHIFTAIQCIGRKRIINQDDKVNVYVRLQSMQYIENLYKGAVERYLFMSNPREGRDRYIREHGINQVVNDSCYLDSFSIGEYAGDNVPATYIRMAVNYALLDAYEAQIKILNKVNRFAKEGDKTPYASAFLSFYDTDREVEMIHDYYEDYKDHAIRELAVFLNKMELRGYPTNSEAINMLKNKVKVIRGKKGRYDCKMQLEELGYSLDIKEGQRIEGKQQTVWVIGRNY